MPRAEGVETLWIGYEDKNVPEKKRPVHLRRFSGTPESAKENARLLADSLSSSSETCGVTVYRSPEPPNILRVLSDIKESVK